ncbi:MAG TPA: carboxypeptidase-like regulatory domain-containing protein [Chthoniobacterales bacterium]|nr:carboxypeptidase-like regulatory domain-containing protein [Chthoniobacterales bacterium]
MKTLARQLVVVLTISLVSAAYGGLPVAGVEVMVQPNEGSNYVPRAVTNAQGKFAIEGLAPGKYNVAFQPAKGNGKPAPHRAVVGDAYSITITGAAKPFAQTNIASKKFAKGIYTTLEVRAGAKIRGQVTADKASTMVWIDKELGSHIPGHWADANSAEAKAAGHSNTVHISREGVNQAIGDHVGFHQEGWKVGGGR